MADELPVDATLVDRIRFARKLRGFSARGLSEAAGLADPHVAMIERNPNATPTAETVAKIARVLEVSLDWLINGEGDLEAPQRAANGDD